MIKKNITYFFVAIIFIGMYSCSNHSYNALQNSRKLFSKIASEESRDPIYSGTPGKIPYWNEYSTRFIYAPSFNFSKVKNAVKYRYKISDTNNLNIINFEKNVPYAPLSSVWTKMPVGYYKIKVAGISSKGDSIGLAGEKTFYRAAYFQGPYHNPVMDYKKSGMIALDSILHESYVNYWLKYEKPDPSYALYRYPTKIYGSIIKGAVLYAKHVESEPQKERAIKLAKIVADQLISISFSKGAAWEYCPPTYYGPWIDKMKKLIPANRLDNFLPNNCELAGNAYLDLYDLTGIDKYLTAAKQIAESYVRNQLDNGTWYLFLNPITGKPISELNNLSNPIDILNYLTRLSNDYNMKELDTIKNKALNYLMENPVKTFNWTAQFEDGGTNVPYINLTEQDAASFAIFLLKYKSREPKYVELALNLIRFSEDQFVIWEKPRFINDDSKLKGRISTNWITPCAMEQYYWWLPTSTAATLMIKAFWNAYNVTQKPIYLAKAKSLANSITIMQKENNGAYKTYFTDQQVELDEFNIEWLNVNELSAEVMIGLGIDLGKANR